MNATHTPGPWIVANGLQVWHDGKSATDSPRICQIRNSSVSFLQLPDDEMAANARIIAQAPTMLSAMKRVLAAHDTKNRGNVMGEAVLCNFFAEMFRQIIAEAEGT